MTKPNHNQNTHQAHDGAMAHRVMVTEMMGLPNPEYQARQNHRGAWQSSSTPYVDRAFLVVFPPQEGEGLEQVETMLKKFAQGMENELGEAMRREALEKERTVGLRYVLTRHQREVAIRRGALPIGRKDHAALALAWLKWMNERRREEEGGRWNRDRGLGTGKDAAGRGMLFYE